MSAAQRKEVASTKDAAQQALNQHEAALENLEDEYQAKLLVEYNRVEQLEEQLASQQTLATRYTRSIILYIFELFQLDSFKNFSN